MKTTLMSEAHASAPLPVVSVAALRACAFVARSCAALVIGLAVWALSGLANRGSLAEFRGYPSFAPTGSLVALLLAVALVCLTQGTGPRAHTFGRATAALAGSIGLAVTAEYCFDVDLGFDGWVQQLSLCAGITCRRLAPITSINAVLMATALLSLDVRSVKGHRPAEYLALWVMSVAFVIFCAYFFGAASLYRVPGAGNAIGMSLYATVTFMLLAVGTICAVPSAGLITTATSALLGGLVARRLLLAALLVPALGLLIMVGQHQGLFGSSVSAALLSVSGVLGAIVLVFVTARTVNRADLDRRAASAERMRWEAILLERERAGRLEAEADWHRAVLLGDATALMSKEPDYEGVFDALTRLCARSFADFAFIDVIEDGRVVRIAGAHRDPTKEPLLRELAERYPATDSSPSPIAAVVARGVVNHLPAISEEQLRTYAVDERHFELARRLGTRSLVSVPLVARDARLGALTMVSATPNRFAPADIELAIEVGRRAAMAVDNARLLRQTREALRLREDFLSVASHELRTPLTALRLLVDSLLRSVSSGKRLSGESHERYLRRIQQQTERLEHLTGELLDVTRIESGQLELEPSEVELGDLVKKVARQLERSRAASGSTLSIHCEEPVCGMWDATRLEQIVTNLVTNAIKFGSGRPIEVLVEPSGDRVRLVVRDHGIGIDPLRTPFVFERFERAVPWTSYGGLGLGLYVAHSLVHALGGTIGLESELGVGSTFTVELPVGTSAVPTPMTASA